MTLVWQQNEPWDKVKLCVGERKAYLNAFQRGLEWNLAWSHLQSPDRCQATARALARELQMLHYLPFLQWWATRLQTSAAARARADNSNCVFAFSNCLIQELLLDYCARCMSVVGFCFYKTSVTVQQFFQFGYLCKKAAYTWSTCWPYTYYIN